MCEPDHLLPETLQHAEILAAKPITSLVAVKQSMAAPIRPGIADARAREDAYIAEMMGAAANSAA